MLDLGALLSGLVTGLREGVEAALIIAIVCAYLAKTGNTRYFPRVLVGAGLAVALSVVLGIAIFVAVGGLSEPYEQYLEAAMMVVAAVVVTWMLFWMKRQAAGLGGELRSRVDRALTEGGAWGLTILAFTAVIREGIETAVFLVGQVAAVREAGAAGSLGVLIGAVAGLVVAAAIGYVVYAGTRRIDSGALLPVDGHPPHLHRRWAAEPRDARAHRGRRHHRRVARGFRHRLDPSPRRRPRPPAPSPLRVLVVAGAAHVRGLGRVCGRRPRALPSAVPPGAGADRHRTRPGRGRLTRTGEPTRTGSRRFPIRGAGNQRASAGVRESRRPGAAPRPCQQERPDDTDPPRSSRPGTRLGLLAVGALAGLVVATAFAPARGAAPVRADSATDEHTIAVTGTGVVTVKPDVADVRLGVSVQRPTVKEAQADAATAMTAVLTAVKAAGIAERDIQTTAVSLSPVYDYPQNGGQKLVGYQFVNSVSVTVRDLSKIAGVIDGAIAAGANTVDGVSFRVEDPQAAEDLARTAAMADAKRRADALASEAGVRITGVATIVETYAPTPMPAVLRRRRAGQGLHRHADPGGDERRDRVRQRELHHRVAPGGSYPGAGGGRRQRPAPPSCTRAARRQSPGSSSASSARMSPRPPVTPIGRSPIPATCSRLRRAKA